MTLRANFQKRYLGRYLAIAGIGLFMAAWFAFDGFIGYPQEQRRSAAHEELASKIKDKKELLQQWRELAKSNGWNVNTPKGKVYRVRREDHGPVCLRINLFSALHSGSVFLFSES